jgi:hypothetical protein
MVRGCLAVVLVSMVLVTGCSRTDAPATTPPTEAAQAAAPAHPGDIVDSAITPEESLRRFKQGLTEPTALAGGYRTREALVRAFFRAVESSDTTALRRMLVTPAEFAWYYYPNAPVSKVPYELPAALAWFQIQGESNKGITKLFNDWGGKPLGYVSHTCTPREEGPNRIHAYCVETVKQDGKIGQAKLFGLILEVNGSFKFLSYANAL